MTSDFRSKIEEQKPQMDKTLLVTVILLLMVGLLMVYSSSSAISSEYQGSGHHFFKMQALWCLLGLVAMTATSLFRYRNYERLSWILLAVAAVLLVLVYMPNMGVKRGGGTRWVRFGRFTFQPVEFAKLAIIIYMASFLTRNNEHIGDFRRGILPSLIVLAILLALIYKQPDFGSVVLIGAVVFVMLFAGGARIYQMALMALVTGSVAAIEIVRTPYRLARLKVFLNPWQDAEGTGYHMVQSLYALGSGGVLGRGLGAGMQKLHYLPVPHSDFIFAIIGEELGFIGSFFIIVLYMVIIWRGIRISLSIEERFGSLLAMGITSLLGIQAMINIGVVIGALPTKGLTLPFVSFGGSSMLISLTAIGILLNISKSRNVERRA